MPLSDTTLNACVTPAPPGVTAVMFAIELPATTRMIVWKLTGMLYAPRNTAMMPSPASQLIACGSTTRPRNARGCTRIPPPTFACSHHFRDPLAQRLRHQEQDHRDARQQQRRGPGCSLMNPSCRSNDPPTVRNRYT